MLGAGVFVVFAPAAALAGPLLAVAVALAGVIAYCNAVAYAQLAAQYPSSGGTYVYGRKRLGEWPGFIAGWGVHPLDIAYWGYPEMMGGLPAGSGSATSPSKNHRCIGVKGTGPLTTPCSAFTPPARPTTNANPPPV